VCRVPSAEPCPSALRPHEKTPQDALSADARERYRLLWLNSIEVLSKALMIGISINGASNGLLNHDQERLNLSPVRPLHSMAQAGPSIDPGMRHR